MLCLQLGWVGMVLRLQLGWVGMVLRLQLGWVGMVLPCKKALCGKKGGVRRGSHNESLGKSADGVGAPSRGLGEPTEEVTHLGKRHGAGTEAVFGERARELGGTMSGVSSDPR